MKKNFPLESENHKPARVIERIKSDVRKYLKRERRKKLPEDADYLDFDCRVGIDAENAKPVHVAELPANIDLVIQESSEKQLTSIYIEILAKPGVRLKRPKFSGTEAESTSAPVAPGD